MNKIINRDNVESFAYTNGHLCKSIREIVLVFHGLGGGTQLIREDSEEAVFFAENDALYVFPYYGPWSWMNAHAVKTVDLIVEALIEKYDLPADIPVISTGGSMGGLSALAYTHHSSRTPTACAANCPVCDLPYHFTERPDLPRTIWSAFGWYEGDFEAAMRTASPLHLAATMPDVPYYIAHCDADMAVNKGMHSDRLIAAMRTAGRNLTYDEIPGMGHCQLPEANRAAYNAFILSFRK
ncbi:MAG: hypothetical protein E7463_03715 [Ruminococcaceae bacterium]|nr:hypothetical protein [Oscillospiraceae bacterium]